MSNRTLLRRSWTPLGSDAAYLAADAIEIDSTQNYEVLRRRVYFDDVHLVTIHRARGIAFLVTTGVIAAIFIGFAIVLVAVDTDTWPVALSFFLVGMAALIPFLIRVAVSRSIVTVFGRRSKAVVRFGSFGSKRARAVYGQICSTVRRAQSGGA
jgi:hypothetical protein